MKKESSRSDATACVKCGTCNTLCPVYGVTGNEAHTPRGKQHLVSRTEKHTISAHYGDIFSRCLLCGACRDACPRGLDTPELVVEARSGLPKLAKGSLLKYVSRKALVRPSLLAGLARLGTAAARLGELLPAESGLRLRLEGFNGEILEPPPAGYAAGLRAKTAARDDRRASGPEPETAYFIGCLANHLQPEIAGATQSLVAAATGSEAEVPLEQTCCGMAAVAAGRVDEARDLARKNIAAFENNGLPILASCSSCYYQLMSYRTLLADDPDWRQRAVRFAGRVREFSSFFLERFSSDTGQLLRAAAGERVFYHDPCHLRFTHRITREPRELLRLLPSLELEELPAGPRCCGQGGLFQLAHPDLALQVRQKLLDEFSELAAQTVLTSCSGCLLQWKQGLAACPGSGRAEHLAVFLAKHLQ
jgi:glycolate oxidase iron-sulfur subunit